MVIKRIKTSAGAFTRTEFIEKCNEGSFPEGLKIYSSLDLTSCSSIKTLPNGLVVGEYLSIHGCISLTALPVGLHVGEAIFVDSTFMERYPFRDIPKILHLPFLNDRTQILIERLDNGY